jgi:xanthine dehydrogenase accessory factor
VSTEILRRAIDLADAKRPFALLIVLKDAGSTPRKAGTRAVVAADGTLFGTIGGGLMESEARRAAVEAIASGAPVVRDFKFGGTRAEENDPVCGGTMRVLIDPAAGRHRDAYAHALERLRRRERCLLVTTAVGGRDGPTSVQVRCVPPDAPATASEPDTLAEPLSPPPLLLIVGGGHVGQALARQASLLDFEIVVIDDRPEFADPGRFPPGVVVRCGDVAEQLKQFPLNPDTYVALVSRGHRVDSQALEVCVRSGAAYVGMMGSRRKVALVRKMFLEQGLATAEEFDRVHAPIGLDVGADTVPEIAASIVAQLVAVRRQGTGK